MAFSVKLLPVKASITVVPPAPVTVPLTTFRRLTVNALGPELSVLKLDRPSIPVVFRFSAAEDVNW